MNSKLDNSKTNLNPKKKGELFAEKLSFVIYFICLVCGNSGFKTWILGWFSRVNLDFFFNLIL